VSPKFSAALGGFNLHDFGAVEYGYAATVHNIAGATVDRVFVLATLGMDRHLAYVGMSGIGTRRLSMPGTTTSRTSTRLRKLGDVVEVEIEGSGACATR
jgi:hypothetical protein